MDELTRERFLPLPTPPPYRPQVRVVDSPEVVAERVRILLGDDSEDRKAAAEAARTARMRAYLLRRDRKLAAAIRRTA